MFLSYTAGMAVVLMSIASGAALLKGIVVEWFRGGLPYVHRIGAILLVLAGAYLIWYQGRYLPLVAAGCRLRANHPWRHSPIGRALYRSYKNAKIELHPY